MARDLYEVLGVGRDADPSEIQRAYRKEARRHHPDVNKDPAAEERFKELSEAYDVLSDPDQRKRYNAFGEDFRRVPPDVDPAEWRQARTYAGAGARPGGSTGGAGYSGGVRFTDFGDDIDLEDLLGGMFGGRRGAGWGRVQGSDQETEVEITVEEAYHGAHRALSISGPEGSRSVDVTIPRGWSTGSGSGSRARVARASAARSPATCTWSCESPPILVTECGGRNLQTLLPLTPWEAALGASVDIDTPGGPATVKVPAGTSSGRRLRLKGRGLPNRRGTPGNLLAEAQTRCPISHTGGTPVVRGARCHRPCDVRVVATEQRRQDPAERR